MNINLKGITKDTWVRIIGLVLVLINQVSISFFNFQILPFDDAEVYEKVSSVLTVIMAIVAGWKNNSVTVQAQEADKVLRGE